MPPAHATAAKNPAEAERLKPAVQSKRPKYSHAAASSASQASSAATATSGSETSSAPASIGICGA